MDNPEKLTMLSAQDTGREWANSLKQQSTDRHATQTHHPDSEPTNQDVPMMLLQLNAIDRFDETEKSGYIEQLIILVKEEIQVPGIKIKVHLTDIKIQMIGSGKTYRNTTF